MAEFVTTTGAAAPRLAVSGDLDISGVEEFLSHAGRLLDAGTTAIEIDLAGVTFIDSSGLGALVRLQKSATAGGQQLRLANVPRPVTRILDLTGLTELFEERPDS
ncbi:STAS domain-containing protein [Nocardioides sp. CER19]|uniref:STAS domain-containing protein n=1 Tax=Nocardioides sp. CER19 TaxID=3038538 RepID=UPI00244B769A|nr:STAS domain-containing protein [Nocardioides sp. CER19]MDH2412684.1 STAS domain-containing protein [Nocardioides sp. CER19]